MFTRITAAAENALSGPEGWRGGGTQVNVSFRPDCRHIGVQDRRFQDAAFERLVGHVNGISSTITVIKQTADPSMTPAVFLHIHSILVILLTVCCWRHASAEGKLNIIHARLINMLKTKQKFHFRRTIRNSMDLREHKVFHSDPQLDCCPTVAEQVTRYKGINPQGIMLELFTFQNFTQTFYEVHCHPAIKSGQCRYIDPRIAHASRCIQQYSYVYSIARTYGAYDEGFRLERIRVASGCKCSIVREYIGKRRRRDIQ